MIYLASPYSHPDPAVRQERYEQTMAAQAFLLREGRYVYSPIVASHPMALAHDLPTDAGWWKKYNHGMMNVCSEVFVLRLDGWDTSVGVLDEIAFALHYGIPITHCTWTDGKVVLR